MSGYLLNFQMSEDSLSDLEPTMMARVSRNDAEIDLEMQAQRVPELEVQLTITFWFIIGPLIE